jgi:hypothetical protein
MTRASNDKKAVKPAQPKAGATRDDKDVHGEGNYSAARRFDALEGEFVEKNRQKIPGLGKDAEQALDGPEGDELRKAEDRARSRSRAPGGER